MSKQRAQSTRQEAGIAEEARTLGTHYYAERIDRPGMNGPADIIVRFNGLGIVTPGLWTPVALFWHRLVKVKGQKRRVPDGVKEVVVIDKNTFWTIWTAAVESGAVPGTLYVEAKASEYENVTRVLAYAQAKVAKWWS